MQWLTAQLIFDGFSFQEQLYLLVDEGGIILKKQNKPPQEFEEFPGLIMPGLINAHCHLELSHLKGKIEQNTQLIDFLKEVNVQNRNVDQDLVQKAAEQADHSMYNQGIVVVGDISNLSDTISIKKNSKLFYHSFIECICTIPQELDQRFFHYANVLHQFKTEQLSASLALHAAYSCCPELFEAVVEHSNFISIHNQESESENQLFNSKSGPLVDLLEHFNCPVGNIVRETSASTAFRNSLDLLSACPKRLFVHNVHTNRSDLKFAGTEDYFCLCPKANEYIEGQLPQIQLYSELDNVVLGTDSLASNSALSILDEILCLQRAFPEEPLDNMFKWATSNGARLFDLEDRFGSFKIGSEPGFIHIPNFDLETRKLSDAALTRLY